MGASGNGRPFLFGRVIVSRARTNGEVLEFGYPEHLLVIRPSQASRMGSLRSE